MTPIFPASIVAFILGINIHLNNNALAFQVHKEHHVFLNRRPHNSNIINSKIYRQKHGPSFKRFNNEIRCRSQGASVIRLTKRYSDTTPTINQGKTNEENSILSYLPSDTLHNPSEETINLLSNITLDYINGNTNNNYILSILDIIDAEYDYDENTSFTLKRSQSNTTISYDTNNEDVSTFIKLLSFCAINQLPYEITCFILHQYKTPNNPSKQCIDTFTNNSNQWKCITFTTPLSPLQPKTFKQKRFFRKQSKPKLNANQLIQSASNVTAPIQKIKSLEEFITTLDQQPIIRSTIYNQRVTKRKKKVSKMKHLLQQQTLYKQFMQLQQESLYFPTRSKLQRWKRRQKIRFKQQIKALLLNYKKMQKLILYGFVSYMAVFMLWYIFNIFYTLLITPSTSLISSVGVTLPQPLEQENLVILSSTTSFKELIFISFSKLLNVLNTVQQRSKSVIARNVIARIVVSILSIPIVRKIGDTALFHKFFGMEDKRVVSEKRIFWSIYTLFIGVCGFVWLYVVLNDVLHYAFLSK